ncbi:thioredoxin domain-containing protein, partial [Rhodococcus koreensis]
MTITVTDDTFEAVLCRSPWPVLVHFWNGSCEPSRLLKPVLEEIAVNLDYDLTIAELDVDANPTTPASLFAESPPYLILFSLTHEPILRMAGPIDKDTLTAALAESLRPPLENVGFGDGWWEFRRLNSVRPIADTQDVDEEQFDSPTGDQVFALPRYALVFDTVADADEPRIVIAQRDGVPTVSVTLVKTDNAEVDPQAAEMPHESLVWLGISAPGVDGALETTQFSFESLTFDANKQVLTAHGAIDRPGFREQLVAAFGSLAANTTLHVTRAVRVAAPTGRTFEDGEPAYDDVDGFVDSIVSPAPLVLSDRQRGRLGGAAAGAPMRRLRLAFRGRVHTFWQDPVDAERFYFLPDVFLLARSDAAPRAPTMRIHAVANDANTDPRVAMEFTAQPVVDPERLRAAVPALAQDAADHGSTKPVRLEQFHEAQPLLRLTLPRDGIPTLTDHPETVIDLESGLLHAETFTLADFRVVYDAFFGASLTVMRGEIRVAADGPAPEDIPLELRLDRTAGESLRVTAQPISFPTTEVRLTNQIE